MPLKLRVENGDIFDEDYFTIRKYAFGPNRYTYRVGCEIIRRIESSYGLAAVWEGIIYRAHFKTEGRKYMNNIVLMVVDVQNALIEAHPHNEWKVIENIKKLISVARDNGKEVLYVRHNEEGSEFEKGTEGWQIYDEVVPDNNEMIFDKQYNSAFLKTGLREYLEGKEIDTVILVGLQTEYCIDATCKSAFDYGYKIILPEETNTTFDNEYLSGDKLYEFYNYRIWNNRFAKVMPVEDVINILRVK